MTKKSTKSAAPVKKMPEKAPKKSSKKRTPKEKAAEEEDWNSPVFIEPKAELDRSPITQMLDGLKKHERPSTDIRKAKIKNELFLEVEYSEMIKDVTNTVKKDCTAPVHNDLKEAFKKLDAHLCGISEQFTEDGKLDTDNITCRGFSVGGDGEGVTLFGSRKLSTGKALNFLSPFHKWEADTVEYKSDDNLQAAVALCKAEVIKYLFEGKHQPDAQMSLDLN